jgi:arsenate reductase (glutaredoxin)
MKPKVYVYEKCDTCRRAVKFLQAKGIEFEAVPIRERPPTKAELRRMLGHVQGNLRRLFNTSGQDYRAMKLGERLQELSEAEAIDLLASNGNLIKRPFLLTKSGGAVGFDEAEWKKMLG